MITHKYPLKPLIMVGAFVSLAACSSTPMKWDGADNARGKLTRLQSDPQLASRAPVATKEAELAVQAAEKPNDDSDLAKHLVFMAERKVDIAMARAQGRLYEDQRPMLNDQREAERLASRTREASNARSDASAARADAKYARSEASSARADAEKARMETAHAQQDADDLQQQIKALNAKETDRGLVITLGDLLFASGMTDLRGGTTTHLDKLAAFLNKYPDRTVIIEGHTDNVGAENFNQGLSQHRADKVKIYLMSKGVSSERLSSYGMGESSPVYSNTSAGGRQQNRRVEVIIAPIQSL